MMARDQRGARAATYSLKQAHIGALSALCSPRPSWTPVPCCSSASFALSELLPGCIVASSPLLPPQIIQARAAATHPRHPRSTPRACALATDDGPRTTLRYGLQLLADGRVPHQLQ